MEVLELACGTGSTAIHHAPFVKHILAVDILRKTGFEALTADGGDSVAPGTDMPVVAGQGRESPAIPVAAATLADGGS